MTEFAGERTSSVRGSPKRRCPQNDIAVVVIGGHSVLSVLHGEVVDRRNPG